MLSSLQRLALFSYIIKTVQKSNTKGQQVLLFPWIPLVQLLAPRTARRYYSTPPCMEYRIRRTQQHGLHSHDCTPVHLLFVGVRSLDSPYLGVSIILANDHACWNRRKPELAIICISHDQPYKVRTKRTWFLWKRCDISVERTLAVKAK